MSAPESPERLEFAVPAVATSLAPVRLALRGWLLAAAVPADVVEDLTIATNEAVANAIENGSCDPSATVRVRAVREVDRLAIEVIDSGCPRRQDGDDPRRGRGRGVAVMQALTDSFRIEQSTTGTTVRLERVL